VVNLDGKVNPEVLKYKGRMYQYLLDNEIYWLCDFSHYIEQILGEKPETFGWRRVANSDNIVLYHYEPGH